MIGTGTYRTYRMSWFHEIKFQQWKICITFLIFLNSDCRILCENLLVPTLNGFLSVVPRKKGKIRIWANLFWTFGWNDFWQVFFQLQIFGQRFPCTEWVSNIFSVFWQSQKKGSGSGHKSRDLEAKCFFSIKKSSRGSPAHGRFLKFSSAFGNSNSLEKETLINEKTDLNRPFLIHLFS